MRLFRLLSFLLLFAATGAEARGLLDWAREDIPAVEVDRKSTRLNSSHT